LEYSYATYAPVTGRGSSVVVLGDRLIGLPVSVGYRVTTIGAVALALNGIVLLVAAAWARRKSLPQQNGVFPERFERHSPTPTQPLC
jgi:hypothetical protein